MLSVRVLPMFPSVPGQNGVSQNGVRSVFLTYRSPSNPLPTRQIAHRRCRATRRPSCCRSTPFRQLAATRAARPPSRPGPRISSPRFCSARHSACVRSRDHSVSRSMRYGTVPAQEPHPHRLQASFLRGAAEPHPHRLQASFLRGAAVAAGSLLASDLQCLGRVDSPIQSTAQLEVAIPAAIRRRRPRQFPSDIARSIPHTGYENQRAPSGRPPFKRPRWLGAAPPRSLSPIPAGPISSPPFSPPPNAATACARCHTVLGISP